MLEGYKVGVFYKYAIDKKAVNQKGGCSSYRKPEETNQNAFEMEKMFPGFVRAVKKEKKSWNGYDEVWDVNISWKKRMNMAGRKEIFNFNPNENFHYYIYWMCERMSIFGSVIMILTVN